MVREAKEPTIVTLRSDLKKILESYFPDNNFEVKVFSDKTSNIIHVIINGCDFEEKEKEIIKNFVDYKAKLIHRKKKKEDKEKKKIWYEKTYFTSGNVVFIEDCKKYWSRKFLLK